MRFFFQSNMNVVQSCPKTEEEIGKARARMACGHDSNRRDRYMCIPDKDLKSLKEFCLLEIMGLQEEGINFFYMYPAL